MSYSECLQKKTPFFREMSLLEHQKVFFAWRLKAIVRQAIEFSIAFYYGENQEKSFIKSLRGNLVHNCSGFCVRRNKWEELEIIEQEEWYQALIEECKAIITEAVFIS